jgi:phage terminase Nu1 subunit (DNA packaging protein)
MDSPDSFDRFLPATLDKRIDNLRKEIAAAKQRLAPTLDLEQALLLLLGAKRRIEEGLIQPQSSQGKSE